MTTTDGRSRETSTTASAPFELLPTTFMPTAVSTAVNEMRISSLSSLISTRIGSGGARRREVRCMTARIRGAGGGVSPKYWGRAGAVTLSYPDRSFRGSDRVDRAVFADVQSGSKPREVLRWCGGADDRHSAR